MEVKKICGNCVNHDFHGRIRTCKVNNRKVFYHHTCERFESIEQKPVEKKKNLFQKLFSKIKSIIK